MNNKIFKKLCAMVLTGGLLLSGSPLGIDMENVYAAEKEYINTSKGKITFNNDEDELVDNIELSEVCLYKTDEGLIDGESVVSTIGSEVEPFYSGLYYESTDDDNYEYKSASFGICVVSNYSRDLTDEEIEALEGRGSLKYVDNNGDEIILSKDSSVGEYDTWTTIDGVSCLNLGYDVGAYVEGEGKFIWEESVYIDDSLLYYFAVSFNVKNTRTFNTVTYDLNGGYLLTGDFQNGFTKSEQDYVIKIADFAHVGDRYVVPQREGYTFLGYRCFEMEDEDEKYIFSPGVENDYAYDEIRNLIRDVSSYLDMKFVAQWEEKSEYIVKGVEDKTRDIDVTNTTASNSENISVKIAYNGFVGDIGCTPNAEYYPNNEISYLKNYSFDLGDIGNNLNLNWSKGDIQTGDGYNIVSIRLWKKDALRKVTGLKEIPITVTNSITNEEVGKTSIYVNLIDNSSEQGENTSSESQEGKESDKLDNSKSGEQTTNPTDGQNNSSGNKTTPTKSKKVTKKKQKITAKNYIVSMDNKQLNLKAKSTGNGKLSYKSSNAKVASVSKNGVVTIKGVGSTVITISAKETSKFKSSTKKIIVKVNPKKQEFIKKKIGYDNKTSNLKLVWKKDKNADYYQIQRAVDEKFKVKSRSKTIKKNSAAIWLDSSTFYNTEYYFRVRSVKKIKGKLYYGEWSTPFIANFRKQR